MAGIDESPPPAKDADIPASIARDAEVAGLYVAKSLFDANTVLKADADDTPIALSVGAAQVVGRKASGGIVAMTMAELKTLLDAGAASGLATLDGSSRVAQEPKIHGLRGSAHTDPFLPSGAVAQNYSRNGLIQATNCLISARLSLYSIYVPAGPISAVTFFDNAAAVAPTHQWFGLWDANKNKLFTTADDFANSWPNNTAKTLYASRTVTDAAITSGTATLTSATAAFTSTDVGKQVIVAGAGAAGAPLGAGVTAPASGNASVTIASVQSGTSCTLSANAGSTVSGATAYIATPYTLAADAFCYGAILTVAGTVPTMLGVPTNSAVGDLNPRIGGVADTGLSTPATAPSPAGTILTNVGLPYFYVS